MLQILGYTIAADRLACCGCLTAHCSLNSQTPIQLDRAIVLDPDLPVSFRKRMVTSWVLECIALPFAVFLHLNLSTFQVLSSENAETEIDGSPA